MYRFLFQGGANSPVIGAVTGVKLLGRNRNCQELPNAEAQQGQGCCSSMMPTSLTGSESLYGRHTCMHIHTYIHTNGALSRPQGLSNSWPGPPLPLSQQAITPSTPLPATPCGHMPHSPARQAQCWPNSLAAHPCHALWWHCGHMGLLLLVHTHTHKHAVQGAPHQGQLLEIEFIEKLGQSVLVRSRHGQKGILAYACYTKLFPFLPFCLCFLTLVLPLTITFPTFISFPKHPTSPVQSPNALPCTPHGTLHARQCPGQWSDPESLLADS